MGITIFGMLNDRSVTVTIITSSVQLPIMHAQLSDKKVLGAYLLFSQIEMLIILACRELVQALEECHATGWAKFTGGCNKHKDELNKCLRSEVFCCRMFMTFFLFYIAHCSDYGKQGKV